MEDDEKSPSRGTVIDDETGFPIVGGPMDARHEELVEIPLPPQIIADLRKAEEARGNAEALAANLGLAVLDVLRSGFKALRDFEESKSEHNRMLDRAAKSTGVGVQRVRGFDLERGVATYAKTKEN